MLLAAMCLHVTCVLMLSTVHMYAAGYHFFALCVCALCHVRVLLSATCMHCLFLLCVSCACCLLPLLCIMCLRCMMRACVACCRLCALCAFTVRCMRMLLVATCVHCVCVVYVLSACCWMPPVCIVCLYSLTRVFIARYHLFTLCACAVRCMCVLLSATCVHCVLMLSVACVCC